MIFGRQMGATKEPLTKQNTLPNSTHIHTHPGGGKTQSNKQFEKLELDFAEKEEAVEGPFLTNQCTMEHMRTQEPDGMPYWNAHCLQGTYTPWHFFKSKMGCFCPLTQSPRPNSNMAPPFPGHPRPVHRGLSSHLPIHLKTPNAHWDPIWGRGRGLEQAHSGVEPWKRRGKEQNNLAERKRK